MTWTKRARRRPADHTRRRTRAPPFRDLARRASAGVLLRDVQNVLGVERNVGKTLLNNQGERLVGADGAGGDRRAGGRRERRACAQAGAGEKIYVWRAKTCALFETWFHRWRKKCDHGRIRTCDLSLDSSRSVCVMKERERDARRAQLADTVAGEISPQLASAHAPTRHPITRSTCAGGERLIHLSTRPKVGFRTNRRENCAYELVIA